jgi:hypothetical protein
MAQHVLAYLSTDDQNRLMWIIGIGAIVLVAVAARYVGTMKALYLGFELGLTILWFWAMFWQFGITSDSTSDWGTVVGAFTFMAFGIGTGWMLIHEIITTARQRFGVELNLFRRYHVFERLAARMGPAPEPSHDVPLSLPPEE